MDSNVYTASQLINNPIENVPCIFGNIIPKIGVIALVGGSESGKSLFLRQLCMAVVSDKQLLNWDNKCQFNRALFVSTEDGMQATSSYVKKQNGYFNMTTQESDRLRFIFSPQKPLEAIEEELKKLECDVVVVDSFADILDGGDEKSASYVRALMDKYNKISEVYQCLIIFLHHTSKRSEYSAPSKNSVIGSQSFEAKCRLVLEIREDNVEPNIRHLCIVKGNYQPKEEKMSSYDLKITENLVFETTGTRTPLTMLSITKPNQVNKGANTMPDKLHREFLAQLFGSKDAFMSGAELKRSIIVKFGVGDTLSRNYLQYYRSKSFIVVEKETKNCTTYKLNANYN